MSTERHTAPQSVRDDALRHAGEEEAHLPTLVDPLLARLFGAGGDPDLPKSAQGPTNWLLGGNAAAALVVDAATGTIVLWSDGAERLFGYSREEAVGAHVTRLVPAELRPELAAEVATYNS